MNTRQKCRAALGTFLLCAAAAWSGPDEGLLQNPPPAAPFKGYAGYEIAPLTMVAPFAGQGANEKAAAKIQSHIDAQIKPIVDAWGTAGAASGGKGTLVFTPVIQSIKFIGGGARFWAGALAGSSYVVLTVKISEKESGKVLAEPEFFQRAAAMSGAWTMGGQDNDMLQRIVTVAASYLTANYETAAGGPTGRKAK